MTCDDVREHLAEHLLGSLDDLADAEVRSHLRGCMACRRELAALEEGMSTFARAAHQVEPPTALKDRVLGVLDDERAASPSMKRRLPVARIAAAAVIAVLVGALAWTGIQAADWRSEAHKYEAFLSALGGRDVRVGVLDERSDQPMEGSVVMYDSERGQSWILVLVQAPGQNGEAQVTVTGQGRRIKLFPLKFDPDGEASSWLVTRTDISRFDSVRIVDSSGTLLATARVTHE